MALPDFAKIEHGNIVQWIAAGTPALTLTSLAINAGRMGEAVDLGAQWDEEQAVWLVAQWDIAPTAGGVLAAYLASSNDGATWPGRVTGADAAYPSVVGDNRAQLGNAAVRLVTVGDTVQQVQQPVIWRPPSRHVAPVVINDTDQALSATGSASYMLMIPRRLLVQDTA